jgi:hypothetical protein
MHMLGEFSSVRSRVQLQARSRKQTFTLNGGFEFSYWNCWLC